MGYNGLNATLQSIVQFAAPAAAGALMAVSPLAGALWVNILTAAAGISLALGATLPRPQPPPGNKPGCWQI